MKLLPWATGVVVGIALGHLIWNIEDRADARSHSEKNGVEPKLNQSVSEKDEERFTLAITGSELRAVTADDLVRMASSFSSASPTEYAFINYADRATVDRVTREFLEGNYLETYPHDSSVYTITTAWARLDPETGFAFHEDIFGEEARRAWARASLSAWMSRDFEEAYAAAQRYAAQSTTAERTVNHLIVNYIRTTGRLPEEITESFDFSALPDYQLRHTVRKLAARNLSQAEKLLPLLDEKQRAAVEATMLIPMAQADPLAALEAASRMPESGQANAQTQVYRTWASQNPSAAAAHAFANNAPNPAKEAIFLQWTNEDVPAVHHFLANSVSETKRAVLLEQVFDRTGGAERLKKMEPLLDLIPAGSARDYTVGVFLRHTFGADPQAAMARFQQEAAAGAGYQLASNLLHAEGMNDSFAQKVFETLSPGDRDQVARRLSRHNRLPGISDAFRFQMVTAISDTNQRRHSVSSMMRDFARNQPETARRFLQQIDRGDKHLEAYYGSVAETWSREAPDAAFAWANRIEDDALRQSTVGRTLSVISRNNPDLAIERARSFEEASMRRAALLGLSNTIARRNPEAFSQILEESPAEDLSPNTYRITAREWLKKDSLNGSKWVDRLPKGNNRDHAIIGLVDALRGSDPKSAFVWAADIESPGRRRQTLRNALYTLAQDEPEAALEIFDQTELSEQDRESIRNVLPNPE